MRIETTTYDDPVFAALAVAQGDEARARGFRVARLETGSWQPDAIALYTSSGYHEIPLFGAYVDAPESRCFERSLSC
jgi:putative acetyltransferase